MRKIFFTIAAFLSLTIQTRSDVVVSNLGWTSTPNTGVALGSGISNEILIDNFGATGFAQFQSITIRLFNDSAATSNITAINFNIGSNSFSGSAAGAGIAANLFGNITVDIRNANIWTIPNGQNVISLTDVVGLGGTAKWAYAVEGANTWTENNGYNYAGQTLEGPVSGIPGGSFAQFAVSVPEPGTLLLGSLAAISGLALGVRKRMGRRILLTRFIKTLDN